MAWISVKIVEISSLGDTSCIAGYGYAHISPNIIETNTIKDIDALASCIKKLISQINPSSKLVALAVPDSTVISKTIQLVDGVNDAELEELVLIEADKYLAYPANEINIDFAMLGPSNQNANLVDVLLVASKAENVNRRVEAIARAGLEAKIIDVESYTVQRVKQLLVRDLPVHGQDKIIAVIDIGSLFMHLFILDGERIIYTREEVFAAKHLLDAITQQYEISVEEVIFRQVQLAGYELEVLQSIVEITWLQVKRNLQFFFSTSHYDFVDHIFLAGELARLINLPSLIQEKTSIPTSVANPFKHMDVAKNLNLETLASIAPTFIVACGLALRQLNDD